VTPLILALAMLLVGVFLSAFFSGSETGFYRATRIRLVLDALGGDWVSRTLLWLTNRPSLFVATTLVGNNLANYVTSLAIVLMTHAVFPVAMHQWMGLLAPVALAPVLFVYGELLPKSLFFHAPNRLLRRAGPLLILCGIAFVPVTAVLWLLAWALRFLVGEAPEQLRTKLARTELALAFREGHEAGILSPAQQQIAQGLFAVADQPVSSLMVPIGRMIAVREQMSRGDVLRLARRHKTPVVLVEEVTPSSRRLLGYVRVVDLQLRDDETSSMIRPLMQVHPSETHLAALSDLQRENEPLARVVDNEGETIGLLYAQRLKEVLFRAN
jgi:putative hemolysin